MNGQHSAAEDLVENIDVHGSGDISRAIEGYNYRTQDFSVYDELRDFVAERDPKIIAVNTSDWLAIADGISHSQYVKLEKILGPKYSSRIVSAENVITSFRARRILREVSAMTNALETHRQILERALSNEVITPGVTTLEDVGWWIKEQFYMRDLTRGYSTGVSVPRVLYSAVSEPIDPPDVRWWIHHNDYVLQRGDFFTFDTGVWYLDYFQTDYKRNAYIMREGGKQRFPKVFSTPMIQRWQLRQSSGEISKLAGPPVQRWKQSLPTWKMQATSLLRLSTSAMKITRRFKKRSRIQISRDSA